MPMLTPAFAITTSGTPWASMQARPAATIASSWLIVAFSDTLAGLDCVSDADLNWPPRECSTRSPPITGRPP